MLRRPLVSIFLCISLGCLLGWYGWQQIRWIWFGVVLVSGAILTGSKRHDERKLACIEGASFTSLLLAIVSLLVGLTSMTVELSRTEPLLLLEGKSTTVIGKVLKEKESDYGRSLLIRLINEDEHWSDSFLDRRRIWVYVNDDAEGWTSVNEERRVDLFGPWTGWTLKLTGKVKEPTGPKNPGGFDQRTYFRSQGVQAVLNVKADGVTVLEPSTEWSAKFREILQRRWEPIMGEASCGGLMGLMFGASDLMEDETLDAFQTIGLGHLLAVSGLHVGLAYDAVRRLLGERGNTVGAQVICSMAAIGYAALAGFSASATRAALMIVIHGIGRTLYRPYDMSTAAAAAGTLILMRQPCQIMSSGFQLSMLAAFGLACVLPRLSYSLEMLADRKRSELLRAFGDRCSGMISIQLVMGPICARRFQCLSFWSLLLNPICIALAGFLIPLSMGLAFVTVGLELLGGFFDQGTSSFLWDLISSLFYGGAWFTGSLMDGMMKLGTWVAELPGTMTTSGLPPGSLLLYYCVLFTSCSEVFYLLLRNRRYGWTWLWMAMVFLACHILPWGIGAAISPTLWAYLDYPIVFVDVGQGDCIHIQTPKGKDILIDGGGNSQKNVGKDTLTPYLLSRGVKEIDLALATHLHMDHFQGLTELAQEMPIHQLGIYEVNQFREEDITWKKSLTKLPIIYLKEGDQIQIEEDIWIDVLAPPRKSQEVYEALARDDSDENDACLVFKVHYHGLEILVTGDMGMEGERELLKRGVDVSADILKIGHHGSKYSTSEEFLKAVEPNLAVISVGANYFGHPSDRVIELLGKFDIMVSRTDLDGAVIVKKIRSDSAQMICRNGDLQWPIVLQQKQ